MRQRIALVMALRQLEEEKEKCCMKKEKDFLFRLLNSGYLESIYDNYRSDIVLQNRRMTKVTSFIGSIIMLVLTVAAMFVPSVSKVLPLYLTTAILFIIVYLLVRDTEKHNDITTLICSYVFLTAAFFFALGLDVIQKNPTATTVCVLLVALPLLIVDKPWREFLFFGLASVLFMIETVYIKQSPKASIDVLNSLSFFVIGTFLGYKHNQMVLRNIKGYHLLELQRDTDTLTNLYNKGAIENRAEQYMSLENAQAGMMIIDMDNFKYVNDTYGHHAGDEILMKLAESLSVNFRTTDLISRFGGDEFIIFLPEVGDKKLMKEKAEGVLQEVEQIRIQADPNYRAHVCIGIAVSPEGGKTYEALFKSADQAMYQIKRNGKNGYGFYDPNEKRKILVVDDIEINRAVLRKTLCEEYEVLEAEDGINALNLLEQNPDISMVITDIQMPNMDGKELIRNIRANTKYENVAIVANTQYGDRKQEEQILDLGVDDFVYKVASPQAIQIRVKNVINGKREQ